MSSEDCIFCKIIRKEIPAAPVYEDELVLGFKDIHPLAPVHLLIVPKKHIVNVSAAEASDEAMIGRMFTAARTMAAEAGVAESGYRLTLNNNRDAGQDVFHLHMHLMGGRRMQRMG